VPLSGHKDVPSRGVAHLCEAWCDWVRYLSRRQSDYINYQISVIDGCFHGILESSHDAMFSGLLFSTAEKAPMIAWLAQLLKSWFERQSLSRSANEISFQRAPRDPVFPRHSASMMQDDSLLSYWNFLSRNLKDVCCIRLGEKCGLGKLAGKLAIATALSVFHPSKNLPWYTRNISNEDGVVIKLQSIGKLVLSWGGMHARKHRYRRATSCSTSRRLVKQADTASIGPAASF